MKSLLQPIELFPRQLHPLGCYFDWRGRIYSIADIYEEWLYRGKWWQDLLLWGEQRHYYRVACQPYSKSQAQSQFSSANTASRHRKSPGISKERATTGSLTSQNLSSAAKPTRTVLYSGTVRATSPQRPAGASPDLKVFEIFSCQPIPNIPNAHHLSTAAPEDSSEWYWVLSRCLD